MNKIKFLFMFSLWELILFENLTIKSVITMMPILKHIIDLSFNDWHCFNSNQVTLFHRHERSYLNLSHILIKKPFNYFLVCSCLAEFWTQMACQRLTEVVVVNAVKSHSKINNLLAVGWPHLFPRLCCRGQLQKQKIITLLSITVYVYMEKCVNVYL